MNPRTAIPDAATEEQISLLLRLGDKLFAGAVPHGLLANHASYMRDTSTDTRAGFAVFLNNRSGIFFWLKCACAGFASILRGLFSNGRSHTGGAKKSRILFVSHLTNQVQLNQDTDPYFGDIPKYIDDKIGEVSVLMLNIGRINARGHKLATSAVIESGYFGFFEGMGAFFSNLIISAYLLKRSRTESDKDFKKYLRFLSATQMDHHTLAGMRITKRIVAMAQKQQAEVVLITYEGYAWERAAISALHNMPHPVKVIGYQHATLTGRQRAINKKFGNGIDPDHIITSGAYMTQCLLKHGAFPQSKYTVIGSPKVRDRAGEITPLGGDILAVPQGTVAEAALLAGYMIEVARLMPDTRCVIRMHPLLPWGRVERHVKGWRHRPANLVISSAALDDDVVAAGWVLYRGSSVIINAMMRGRRPIFVDVDNAAATCDIIPDTIRWRRVVKTPQDCAEVVQADLQRQGDCPEQWAAQAEARAEAAAFAKRYYLPIDYEAVHFVIKGYVTDA